MDFRNAAQSHYRIDSVDDHALLLHDPIDDKPLNFTRSTVEAFELQDVPNSGDPRTESARCGTRSRSGLRWKAITARPVTRVIEMPLSHQVIRFPNSQENHRLMTDRWRMVEIEAMMAEGLHMIRRRNLLIAVFAVMVIACVCLAVFNHAISVAYHHWRMEAAYGSLFGNPQPIGNGLAAFDVSAKDVDAAIAEYESHREALVDLGAFACMTASFPTLASNGTEAHSDERSDFVHHMWRVFRIIDITGSVLRANSRHGCRRQMPSNGRSSSIVKYNRSEGFPIAITAPSNDPFLLGGAMSLQRCRLPLLGGGAIVGKMEALGPSEKWREAKTASSDFAPVADPAKHFPEWTRTNGDYSVRERGRPAASTRAQFLRGRLFLA